MFGINDERIALVVDDEAFARLFAVQILLDEGFTVLEASDAAEALELIDRNDDISIVFADISMPGEMDGIGLAEEIARDWPRMDLLLTSGHVRPAEALLPAGTCFLPKPYTAFALMSALRSMQGGQAALA